MKVMGVSGAGLDPATGRSLGEHSSVEVAGVYTFAPVDGAQYQHSGSYVIRNGPTCIDR